MKRLLAVAVCALLVAAAASAARSPLAGTYRTVVRGKQPPVLNGVWTVTFERSGRYVIAKSGTVVVRGKSKVAGNKITFGGETGPAACTGAQASALYRFTLKGAKLTFVPIREQCAGRRVVLTTRPLTRI